MLLFIKNSNNNNNNNNLYFNNLLKFQMNTNKSNTKLYLNFQKTKSFKCFNVKTNRSKLQHKIKIHLCTSPATKHSYILRKTGKSTNNNDNNSNNNNNNNKNIIIIIIVIIIIIIIVINNCHSSIFSSNARASAKTRVNSSSLRPFYFYFTSNHLETAPNLMVLYQMSTNDFLLVITFHFYHCEPP